MTRARRGKKPREEAVDEVKKMTFFGMSASASPPVRRVCDHCHAMFYTEIVSQKHCSDTCRWGLRDVCRS